MAELNEYLCSDARRIKLAGCVVSRVPRPVVMEDQKAFLPLPATPFEACRKFSTTASSLSLVRFDDNDYSVPVRCAHHPIVVKGYLRSGGAVCRWQ